MRPDIVVISGMGLEDLAQVSFAKDDDVIQTFSADRANQPLSSPETPFEVARGARSVRLNRNDRVRYSRGQKPT
jgi:hypothetical protein